MVICKSKNITESISVLIRFDNVRVMNQILHHNLFLKSTFKYHVVLPKDCYLLAVEKPKRNCMLNFS